MINGNYAQDFGLKTEDAIYADTSMDESQYWNLIAARTEDLSDAKLAAAYKAVVKAYQSDETRKVFEDDFNGFFVPAGWDEDLLAEY